MDRLTDMPDNVVEAILECLPMRDAVRTSVLSKKWQHQWETVSRLLLDYVFFDSMYRRRKPPSINYVTVVKNIMLQHHGNLIKFVIYIPDLDCKNRAEINLIVRCALRNGVRELSMEKAGNIPHVLPSFLFSAAKQLTQLKLSNCVFNPPLVFNGFLNLKSLELSSIMCPNLERLSSFISSCQELRRVRMDNLNNLDQHLCVHAVKIEDLQIGGRFKSVSLKGIQDLVSLSIYLEELNDGFEKDMPCKDYMLHIFGMLRKIKYLKLGGYIFDLFSSENFPRKLSPGLDHLNKIVAFSIDLGRVKEVHCLLCLIRSSPNLQELKITAFRETDVDGEPLLQSETQVYDDCFLQHLWSVRIIEFMGAKAELKFMEFLLRCSPVLEIMSVQPAADLHGDAKLEALTELTQYCRASPKARVFLE
ncbi:hypothetical protein RND81_07G049100 [Saponaria officinalis]|uniref:F-box domain-containing protein n=1 Tax=Saponaria officinalis TaxID=3572 RepID=A0AAW1JN92_SAPOF